jgi:hypothetical protein
MSTILLAVVLTSTGFAQEKSSRRKKEEKKPEPFIRALTFNAIGFRVTSPGLDSANTFMIEPSGLKTDHEPKSFSIEGKVKEVLFGDIDQDGWPELVVWTLLPDKVHSELFGFTVNMGRSLLPFNTKQSNNEVVLAQGYAGNDEFQIGDGKLIQRFPIMKGNKKTGKTRQLQYNLLSTEAEKRLFYDKFLDY